MADGFLSTHCQDLVHEIAEFRRQTYDTDRIAISKDLTLNFSKDSSNRLLSKRFPLDGTIRSVPLFINAQRFPEQVVSGLTSWQGNSQTDVNIEFRVANQEDMSDASSWMSIAKNGATSNTEIFAGFNGPFTTSSDLTISTITDGNKFTCKNADAHFESVYWTRLVPEVTVEDNKATYFAVDIKSSRKGQFLEWHVNHGLNYGNDPIGYAKDPFKYLIDISEENIHQTIYWDIRNWPTDQRNFSYVRLLALRVIDASIPFEIEVTNKRLYVIDDPNVASPAGANLDLSTYRFLQYQVLLSTVAAGDTPSLSGISVNFCTEDLIVPSFTMRNGKAFVSGSLVTPDRKGLKQYY